MTRTAELEPYHGPMIDAIVKRASASWHLKRAILEEQALNAVQRLRASRRLPPEEIERLRAARFQCDSAFQELLVSLDADRAPRETARR